MMDFCLSDFLLRPNLHAYILCVKSVCFFGDGKVGYIPLGVWKDSAPAL